MEYRHIAVGEEESFALVRMRRPERRNALSEEHLRELLHAVRSASEGKARGVILSGEGPVFSAGHDFSDMAGRGLPEMRRLLAVCSELMLAIQDAPQVVIAEVEGDAIAAGCQLVASCDLAVASETARFAVPGGRGGWFCTTPMVAVSRAIGRKRALEMLLTGNEVDAATAADWGLVNRVVPAAKLAEETEELARAASRGSTFSKGVGKQAFYAQIDLDQSKAYAYASEVMAMTALGPDGREAITSFVEKRKPKY